MAYRRRSYTRGRRSGARRSYGKRRGYSARPASSVRRRASRNTRRGGQRAQTVRIELVSPAQFTQQPGVSPTGLMTKPFGERRRPEL